MKNRYGTPLELLTKFFYRRMRDQLMTHPPLVFLQYCSPVESSMENLITPKVWNKSYILYLSPSIILQPWNIYSFLRQVKVYQKRHQSTKLRPPWDWCHPPFQQPFLEHHSLVYYHLTWCPFVSMQGFSRHQCMEYSGLEPRCPRWQEISWLLSLLACRYSPCLCRSLPWSSLIPTWGLRSFEAFRMKVHILIVWACPRLVCSHVPPQRCWVKLYD